jgi:uncharacterized membrane protein
MTERTALPLAAWRAFLARPRLAWSTLFGMLMYGAGALFLEVPNTTVALVAWNTAVLVYLALAWDLMSRADAQGIRDNAPSQDEGRMVILVVVVLAAVAVLVAVGSQLGQVKGMQGTRRALHIGLAALTVLTSWFFTQVLFALHYAHDFYVCRIRGAEDPLSFPGTSDPDYGDFFYFACIIGTSAQTADVSFNGAALRPVGTLHCIQSFFFNAGLLALSINLAAGLFA